MIRDFESPGLGTKRCALAVSPVWRLDPVYEAHSRTVMPASFMTGPHLSISALR